MVRIKISYADGSYGVRPTETHEDEDATVRDEVWAAWLAHCAQMYVWQALWMALDPMQNEAPALRYED